MNEKERNKREWVKTAAIVFLSIMLILTFFSNTIMNWSLPEVATQYVESGTITAKIRGTGQIESGDPYEIKAKSSRKVSSVAVRVGDTVEKDAVLFYLEDDESQELKDARADLKEKQDAYDDYLRDAEIKVLREEITQTTVEHAQNGQITSTSGYYKQLADAQAAVDKQAELVDEAQNSISQLETWKAQIENGTTNVAKEKKALEEAQTAYSAKQGIADAIKTEISGWEEEIQKNNQLIRDHEDKKVASTITKEDGSVEYILLVSKEEYETAKKNNEILNNRITNKTAELNAMAGELEQLKTALDKAQAAYDKKLNSGANSLTNANNQIANWQSELESRTKKLEELKEYKEKLINNMVSEISMSGELADLKEAVSKARDLVEKLESEATDAVITADIAGTVNAINVVAGNTFLQDDTLATLQPEGKGYTLSFSVTNEQAKRVSVGDRADLINAWRYDDVVATLASIKPDRNNPGQQKMLTFDVTGEVTAGQTLNLSVGQRSASYDLIVPNSAVREDANGKFILIVEAKPNPLSTRYIATRVDVEVLASDETKTAISAGLYGYEYVITTSNAPVEAGKQVRLANN